MKIQTFEEFLNESFKYKNDFDTLGNFLYKVLEFSTDPEHIGKFMPLDRVFELAAKNIKCAQKLVEYLDCSEDEVISLGYSGSNFAPPINFNEENPELGIDDDATAKYYKRAPYWDYLKIPIEEDDEDDDFNTLRDSGKIIYSEEKVRGNKQTNVLKGFKYMDATFVSIFPFHMFNGYWYWCYFLEKIEIEQFLHLQVLKSKKPSVTIKEYAKNIINLLFADLFLEFPEDYSIYIDPILELVGETFDKTNIESIFIDYIKRNYKTLSNIKFNQVYNYISPEKQHELRQYKKLNKHKHVI